MQQKSPEAFRTIGEVASWLGVPPHVLRFWESKFAQVRPVKRAGGRRYYRRGDMALLGGIKVLLHDRGMTIKGVQRILTEDGPRAVSAHAPDLESMMTLTSDDEAAFDDEAALDGAEVEPEDMLPERDEEETQGMPLVEPAAEAQDEAAPASVADVAGESAGALEAAVPPDPAALGTPTAAENEGTTADGGSAPRRAEISETASLEPASAAAAQDEAREAQAPGAAAAATPPFRARLPAYEGADAGGGRHEVTRWPGGSSDTAASARVDGSEGSRERFAPPPVEGGSVGRVTGVADAGSPSAAASPPLDAAPSSGKAPASELPPPVPLSVGGEDSSVQRSGDRAQGSCSSVSDPADSPVVERDGERGRQGVAPAADLPGGEEGWSCSLEDAVLAPEAAADIPAQETDSYRAASEVPACREDEGPLVRRPATRPAAVRSNRDAVLALVRRLEAVRDRMVR